MNILELLIVLLLLVIIGMIILAYLINRKFTLSAMNYDTVDTWVLDPNENNFNKTNYLNCLNSINYVYDLYVDSVTNVNRILGDIVRQIDVDFLLEDPQILFSQTQISNRLNTLPLLNMQYYTPFGIIARIKNSSTGFISFRGTSNLGEWATDASSFNLVYPSKLTAYKTASKFGQRNSLVGVNDSQLPQNCGVGEGWYDVYASTPGQITENNCVCTDTCKDGTCRILYPNQIGKIVGITECSAAPVPCGLLLCDRCKTNEGGKPICNVIYDYVNENTTINDYIICGHSLGAAVAILCAFHMESVFKKVRCVYAFASPMVGNQDFANTYDAILKDKTFRISNTNDAIPYLPGSTPGKSGNLNKDYVNLSNRCYTFTQNFPGFKPYSSKYHSLNDSYKKSYDTIQTNLDDPSFYPDCLSDKEMK
ncbi:MAG: hypothetical protein CMM15_10565 [Rhodospirillaceae bacterium]|nr:hypothetical protein [Rhodospirillaceae bacterium]OUX68010.1 MAG: hypothetical protein CBD38_00900 [bacterium TMED178]